MSDVILHTEQLGKDFGRFSALRGVTASFRRGALTSIIGPNGAGKSTYFNLISGAFPPSAGKISFEGRDITGTPRASVRQTRDREIVPDHHGVSAIVDAGERADRVAGAGLAL